MAVLVDVLGLRRTAQMKVCECGSARRIRCSAANGCRETSRGCEMLPRPLARSFVQNERLYSAEFHHREQLCDSRIVTGDNASFVFRQARNGLPSLNHVTHVINERKRVLLSHIGIIMSGIGGKNDGSPRRMNPYNLKAVRMLAHPMQVETGRHGRTSAMKNRTASIDMPDHIDHRINVKGLLQDRMTHATARRIGHLTLLDVKPGARKFVEIACVIEVQMGDDDIAD